MPRQKHEVTICILKDPDNAVKGWGWIHIPLSLRDKYNLNTCTPKPFNITIPFEQEQQAKKTSGWRIRGVAQGKIHIEVYPPFNPKGSSNKYLLTVLNEEPTYIRVQKSLSLKAVLAWLKTWCPPDTVITTPSKKALTLNGDAQQSPEYIYFIYDASNNTVKIGRTKDVNKRLKTLQTANSYTLSILKTIRVDSHQEAITHEKQLHQQFQHLQLAGEWFEFKSDLMDYITHYLTQ